MAFALTTTSVQNSSQSNRPEHSSTLAGSTGNLLPLKTTRDIEFDVSEGTWMSLDVSPDGKAIVFELLGDLYAMDITGGRAWLIAGGLPFDSQPTYSPNGSMHNRIRTKQNTDSVKV